MAAQDEGADAREGGGGLIELFDQMTPQPPEAWSEPPARLRQQSQSAKQLVAEAPPEPETPPGPETGPGTRCAPRLSRAMTQPVINVPYFNVRTAPKSDDHYDASFNSYRSRRRAQFERVAEKCGFDGAKGTPARAAANIPGPRPPTLNRRSTAPVLSGAASFRSQHAVECHLARQRESPAGSSPKTARERAKKELGKPSGNRRIVEGQSVYDKAKSRAKAIMEQAGIDGRV